jgi:uncharacterized membrane protein
MKSNATLFGHPIHPMLVTLPIGGFVASLVADIAYLATHVVFWYDAAFWAMAFGVVTALIAAVPGLIDYNTTIRHSERAYPTARRHMLINLTVVAVYAINLYLRHGYAASAGGMLAVAVGLNVLALAALSYSGYLGGHLVYRYGIGLGREDLRISMMESERERVER